MLSPHTLKVNELPSHSHVMTGFYYSDSKESRFYISTSLNVVYFNIWNSDGGRYMKTDNYESALDELGAWKLYIK